MKKNPVLNPLTARDCSTKEISMSADGFRMRSINILLAAFFLGLLAPNLARATFIGDELEARVFALKFSGGWVVDTGRAYNNFDDVNPGAGNVPGFVPLTIDDHGPNGFEIDHSFNGNSFILDFVPDVSDPNKGILNIRLKAEWANIVYNSNGHRLLLEIQGFDLGGSMTFEELSDPFNNFGAINGAAEFPPTSPDNGFTLRMGAGNYGSPHASALQASALYGPADEAYDAVTNPFPIIFSMAISGSASSLPDSGSTLAMLGLVLLGLARFRRNATERNPLHSRFGPPHEAAIRDQVPSQ